MGGGGETTMSSPAANPVKTQKNGSLLGDKFTLFNNGNVSLNNFSSEIPIIQRGKYRAMTRYSTQTAKLGRH